MVGAEDVRIIAPCADRRALVVRNSVAARTKRGGESPDESVQRLVLRYLEAFGPASVRDFGQFTILRRAVTVLALKALGDEVEKLEGPDGATLFDIREGQRPAEDTPA